MLRTRFGQRAPVTETVAATIENGGMFRASGECLCSVCQRGYWRHCALQDPYEFLVLLCNGDVVKL